LKEKKRQGLVLGGKKAALSFEGEKNSRAWFWGKKNPAWLSFEREKKNSRAWF
jgi:hypothetical protein